MRWTGVDWLLTVLSTLTAVAAVIRTSYSSKAPPTPGGISWIDQVLIVFAALAILANAFEAKVHPGLLAQQYRAGDLIMQRAEKEYAVSNKNDAAVIALLARWNEAQNKLEPLSSEIKRKPEPLPQGGEANLDTPSAHTQGVQVPPKIVAPAPRHPGTTAPTPH